MGRIPGGAEVVSPEKIDRIAPDVVIIASVQGRVSIQNQLRSMGVTEDKMFFDGGFQTDNRLALYKQYNNLLQEIPGSIAELGVFRGDTAAIMNEAFPERCLYLFDAFEGFDNADIKTEQEKGFSAARSGDFADTNVELVMSLMPHPEKCIPSKGYFPNSAAGIMEKFALARLDVDLYDPTLAGLHWSSERMSSGGCMIVDDYFNESYAGVRAAVDEFLVSHSNKKLLPFGVGFTAVLV